MSSSLKKKKKKDPVLHKPEIHGELVKIPMSVPMHIVSATSITLLAVLTVLTILAIQNSEIVAALLNTGLASSYVYIALPVLGWLICIGFRFACSQIPLDMWRLPMTVRAGMKKCKGTLLKWMTLLVELETAAAFIYILIALYLGGEPLTSVLLIWLAALVLSIAIPGKMAYDLGKE